MLNAQRKRELKKKYPNGKAVGKAFIQNYLERRKADIQPDFQTTLTSEEISYLKSTVKTQRDSELYMPNMEHYMGEVKELQRLARCFRENLALRSISHHISYDTLYSELGYSNASPKKKFKIRQRTKEILESWKGSFFGDVEIIDYKELKDGQVPKSIVIKFKVHKDRKKDDDWD